MKVRPGPLRNRNFRLLLPCNAISVTGNRGRARGDPVRRPGDWRLGRRCGIRRAAVMVPALIFPLGGVVADRLRAIM